MVQTRLTSRGVGGTRIEKGACGLYETLEWNASLNIKYKKIKN